jgi:hypothetical protein
MIDYIFDHIIEILAILVAFIIFYLQRRKKSLTYITLTSSEVISISDKVKGNNNVQVTYLGKPVSNLQLLEIRVKNTGNLSIKPDDYIEPLAIRYPNTTNMISVDIIDQQLLGVQILPEVSDTTKTILSRTLLNPNDFFDVRILLGDGSRDFSMTGRIVGLSKIQISSNPFGLKELPTRSKLGITIFYILLIFALSVQGASISNSIFLASGIFLLAFMLVVWLIKGSLL